MRPMLPCALEAHTIAATLYLRGTLSTSRGMLALRCCDELPPSVRTLRVNLHGVDLFHPSAIGALTDGLDRWSKQRCGITRLDVPARLREPLRLLG